MDYKVAQRFCRVPAYFICRILSVEKGILIFKLLLSIFKNQSSLP